MLFEHRQPITAEHSEAAMYYLKTVRRPPTLSKPYLNPREGAGTVSVEKFNDWENDRLKRIQYMYGTVVPIKLPKRTFPASLQIRYCNYLAKSTDQKFAHFQSTITPS
jgi:hypothetical protein